MVIKNKSFDIVAGPALSRAEFLRGTPVSFVLKAAKTYYAYGSATKDVVAHDVQIQEAEFEEGSGKSILKGIAKVGCETEYCMFCGSYDSETHKGRLTFFY